MKSRASVVGGATTPKSHNRLKMNELRGAAPPPPVTVKKKMQFSETFFSAKNDFFCCGIGGICYLSFMSTTSLVIAIDNLRKQLELCEDFSDWEGCERIEEEISSLEAILEEKNLTEA